VLSNFCRNLRIGHLVNCFNTDNTFAELLVLKMFFEFTFCLARTKYQNRFCITNARNHLIVVDIKVSRKLSLLAIIRWNCLRFKRTA